MLKPKYRVRPDWFLSSRWQIEERRWYWPFWRDIRGLISEYDEALKIKELYETNEYRGLR